jgi:hypothetical protein
VTKTESELSRARKIQTVSILLGFDEDLLRVFFGHKGVRNFDSSNIKEDAEDYSPRQKLLINAALDFFESSGGVMVDEILYELSDEDVLYFIRALLYFRELDLQYELCECQ